MTKLFPFAFLQYSQMLCREAPNEGAPAPAAGSALGTGTPDADPVGDGVSTDPAVSTEPDAPEETEETKTEDTAAEPVTMEALKLPENMEIPEELQEDFLSVVNDPELSRADLINKLIEMQGASLEASQEAAAKDWADLRTSWLEEARALPEIGGEKFDQTCADIKEGLNAAGATRDAYAAFDMTGAGDNPHIIQLMHKLVQPFLEKKPTTGNPVTTPTDRAERMFPSMAKGK